MIVERRQTRSDHPGEAARLYLDAVARRGAHRGMALADSDGLLVAGSTSELDIETMAAVAPIAVGSAGLDDGLLSLVTRGQPLHVWDVELLGEPYYLAAVGGDRELPTQAHDDLRRILT